MRANLGRIYNSTITLLNKLDAKDSDQRTDEWRKTVLHGCMWSLVTTRTVQADGTVTIGTSHRVQIPEDPAYRPYKEWKEDRRGFTLRTGDYVIKGIVFEDVTPSNYRKVIDQYEPNAFEIQTFRDATKGEGFTHSTAGVRRFSEPYILEG